MTTYGQLRKLLQLLESHNRPSANDTDRLVTDLPLDPNL